MGQRRMYGEPFKIFGYRWLGSACVLALILPGILSCRDDPVVQAYVPKAYAQRMNREAITALYANNPLEALALVNKAIADDSQYPIAYNTKASILASLGREREGVAALEAAIALREDYGQAYLALGILLEKDERADEARARYSRAIDIFEERCARDGFDLEDTVNLAIASYLRRGKVAGIRFINEVLAENPSYREALIIKNRIKRDDRESFLRWVSKPPSEIEEEIEGVTTTDLENESDLKGE